MAGSQRVFKFHDATLRSSCFSALGEMKDNGELCDVTVIVGDESFEAHRVVLCSAIPYFRYMFRSKMAESLQREVLMQGIDPTAMKSLIDFAYTSDLLITTDNVISLLELSEYLEAGNVRRACIEFLREEIDSSNVIGIREYALHHNMAEILTHADSYIRQNFAKVCTSEEFLDLPIFALKEIICRDDLHVTSEDTVFESVLRWVKSSEEERRAHLPDLMCCIRMQLLTENFLSTCVLSEGLILTSPVCKAVVDEARNCSLAQCDLVSRERFCNERHHLKCTERTGFGMYSFSKATKSSMTVNYYDSINQKWAPLPTKRNFDVPSYAVCTEEAMYFIGNDFVHVLCLETLEFTSRSIEMNLSASSGVALKNDKLYVCGGLTNCSKSQKTVLCLDLRRFTCVQVSEMFTSRDRPGAATLGDDVYVMGGVSNGATVLNSVEKCDPVTGRCVQVSRMRKKRAGPQCLVLNSKIYVCGGTSWARPSYIYDGNGEQQAYYSFETTNEVYDPAIDQWSFIAGNDGIDSLHCLFSRSDKLLALAQSGDDIHFRSYISEPSEWRRLDSSIIPPEEESEDYGILVSNSVAIVEKRLSFLLR